MVWLTTDWARPSRRPAAEKLPSSTAAMNVRSWSSDTPSSMYRSERWFVSRYIGYCATGDQCMFAARRGRPRPRHTATLHVETEAMKLLHV